MKQQIQLLKQMKQWIHQPWKWLILLICRLKLQLINQKCRSPVSLKNQLINQKCPSLMSLKNQLINQKCRSPMSLKNQLINQKCPSPLSLKNQLINQKCPSPLSLKKPRKKPKKKSRKKPRKGRVKTCWRRTAGPTTRPRRMQLEASRLQTRTQAKLSKMLRHPVMMWTPAASLQKKIIQTHEMRRKWKLRIQEIHQKKKWTLKSLRDPRN